MSKTNKIDLSFWTAVFVLMFGLGFIWSDAHADDWFVAGYCAPSDRLLCETGHGLIKACLIRQFGDDYYVEMSQNTLEPSTVFINSNSCHYIKMGEL